MDGSRRKWVKAIRLGIPAALIVIGILTIAGCIYIPVAEHPLTSSGRDVRKVVGDRTSNSPLRVGVATREAVLRLLGPPNLRTSHDLAIGYDCRAVAGHYFGLCVGSDDFLGEHGPVQMIYPSSAYAHHLLFLQFDGSGQLIRYQLDRYKYGKRLVEPAWKEFIRSVDDGPIGPAAATGR